jgi:hypothetical protein
MKKILVCIYFLCSAIVAQTQDEQKNYLSENRYRISTGLMLIDQWKTNEYFNFIGSKFFINFSKKFQDYSFNENYPRWGMVNEVGFRNLSVFLKVGPQVLVTKSFSIDLHFGLSLALGTGSETSGLAFIAFYGLSPVYSIPLRNNLVLELEGGVDITLFNNSQLNSYVMVGIAWSFSD